MGIWKRAIIYLKRNKGKTFLLIIGLIVITSTLMECMCLWYGSQKQMRELQEKYGSSFSLKVSENAEGDVPVINDEMVDKIAEVGGIKEVCKMNGTEFMFEDLEFIPGSYTECIKIEETEEDKRKDHLLAKMAVVKGYNESKLSTYFQTNVLQLTEGRHIKKNDHNVILISDDVAEMNNLKVGDKISGTLNQLVTSGWEGEPDIVYTHNTWEIVGIFHANMVQMTNIYTAESEIIQNFMFADNKSMEEITKIFHKVIKLDREPAYYEVIFFAENPEQLNEIMSWIKNINDIDWNMLSLTVDETAYEAALVPLKRIKGISIFMMVFVMIICVIILSLVLRMWIKSRKKEAGILLALGNNRWYIVKQFILEGVIMLCVSVLISLIVVGQSANIIGNQMLTNINENEKRKAVDLEERANDLALTWEEHYAVTQQLQVQAKVDPPKKTDCKLTGGIALATTSILFVVLFVVILFSSKRVLTMKPKEILSSV